MKKFYGLVSLALVLVFIAGCQSTKKDKFAGSGFHIVEVAVTMPAQTATPKPLQYTEGFGTMIDNVVSRYAQEYNATKPNPAKAYVLVINVEKVHFKNALQSLIIGDGNHISGSASLTDQLTGLPVHTQTFKFFDAASAAVNGITGALLSALVKKQAAEATLSKGLAKKVMENIHPKTKLPTSAKSRLKGKAVLQPPVTALSPLAVPTQPQVQGGPAQPVISAN